MFYSFYKNYETYESLTPLELLAAILYARASWPYGVKE